MQWMESEKHPCYVRGLIFPKDERGIMTSDEPEMFYEFRYKMGLKHQEAYQKLIDDLTASIEQFKKQGIE